MVDDDGGPIQQEDDQHDLTVDEWNEVKRKRNSDRTTFPAKTQASPPHNPVQVPKVESNHFRNLSNLDGDSIVCDDELSLTTALVLQSNESGHAQGTTSTYSKHSDHIQGTSGEQRQPGVGPKHKQGSSGVIIKERAKLKPGSK